MAGPVRDGPEVLLPNSPMHAYTEGKGETDTSVGNKKYVSSEKANFEGNPMTPSSLLRRIVQFTAELLVDKFTGTFASALRRRVAKKLIPDTSITVGYGLFKGTRLSSTGWNSSDRVSISLGVYELEVQEWIRHNVIQKERGLVVFGAGDGLYPIGLFRGGFTNRVLCFERDAEARRHIYRNWVANDLPIESLEIGEEFFGVNCHPQLEKKTITDCLFIMDIEGAEFKLIEDTFLEKFSRATGIIEVHGLNRDSIDQLKERISKFFTIGEIRSGARDPSKFPELDQLSDDLRWSIMSEGREWPGYWLTLTPLT